MSTKDGVDNVAGPSSSSTEALSTGRARRSNAGNRMRELLEQERERILAEGEDPSLASSRRGATVEDGEPKKKKSKKGDEDENAIFQNEENDIDFEEREGEGEDIIDSDFDLSSNQGDEDDEEAGEKELVAQEKAAKKASRAKSKGIPMQVRRVAVPPKSALAVDEEAEDSGAGRPARMAKRITFAVSSGDADSTNKADRQSQRSSKRKSTIKFSQTVQARLEEEEERRARQIEKAQPKRKKVRLSQADLIAEALEMEERNRESLKVFLEREEERRERDRRRGKKRLEGPFLRWRSVTVEYGDISSKGRQIMRKPIIEEMKSSSAGGLTEDPVFAARQAAIKEREARQAAEERTKAKQDEKKEDGAPDTQGQENFDSPRNEVVEDDVRGADGSESKTGRKEEVEVPAVTDSNNEKKEMNAEQIATEDCDTAMANGANDVVDDAQAEEQKEVPGEEVKVEEADKKHDGESLDESKMKNTNSANTLPQREARNFISLHELPQSTHWTTIFSHILGDHVDWSRYTIVPSRNRPLRPRLSVCPITGLPAKYRDPRSGIAYANKEAYTNLTAVMQGQYRWTRKAINAVPEEDDGKRSAANSKYSSKQPPQKQLPRYDPLEMGCFLDRIDEPGANNVRKKYLESINPLTIATSSTSGTKSDYIPVGTLAPGDEQALVAAALALPAGTTRSGGRRVNV